MRRFKEPQEAESRRIPGCNPYRERNLYGMPGPVGWTTVIKNNRSIQTGPKKLKNKKKIIKLKKAGGRNECQKPK